MDFTTPIPFQEAIDLALAREPMATALPSRELRKLGADTLRKAVFSSRTTKAEYVQEIADSVERLITPQTESGQRVSFAQVREGLGKLLQQFQYDPERGFPGDDQLGIPPAEAGSLRDLSSEPRLNLMLKTQVDQMLGAGYRVRGMESDRLFNYPCWELVRVGSRKVERLDWERRWAEAGGEFYDGRMIARKDSEVWDQLGSSDLFDDGLDNPYPPFAFNSGMGVIEISRAEAVELGVIEEAEEAEDLPTDLNDAMQASVAGIDPELLAELERELGEEAKRLLGNRKVFRSKFSVFRGDSIRNRAGFLLDLFAEEAARS